MNKKAIQISIILLLTAVSSIKPVLAQARTDDPTFFRDGQDALEREIENLEQQQSSEEAGEPRQPLTIDDRELQWQKFVFQDGGFSIWMPEGTRSEETLVLETATGQLAFDVFATRPKNYRFLAAYSNKIESSQTNDTETLLSLVRDSIAANTNLKLTSDRAISWEQHSGKQLIFQGENETITYRVYAIGQRVYLLAVGQAKAEEISSEAINFFDSFRLLK